MKERNNKKIRLVLSIGICGMFLVMAFTILVQAPTPPTTAGPGWNFMSGRPNMWNTNTGNIGIGTTNPVAKLDIYGNLAINGVVIIDASGHWVGPNMPSLWTLNGNNIYYNKGNVGIGTTNPTSPLEINGIIYSTSGGFKFPDSSLQTTATLQGEKGEKGDKGDTGSTGPQGPPGPGSSFWSLNGNDVYYNNGNVGIGTASPLAKLQVYNGTVLFNGTGTPPKGVGTRLMWIPSKAAFRAGLTGHPWQGDDSIIGYGSVGMGEYTRATNESSIAIGESTTASGWASIAMGYGTWASNDSSIAMGYLAEAHGRESTAIGDNSIANGWDSTAIGAGITVNGIGSLGIGLGIVSPVGNFEVNDHNVMSIMNGNVGIGTTSPSEQLTVTGGSILLENSYGQAVIELASGSDYSEGFNVSHKNNNIGPGTVLVIDSENPGTLEKSSAPYDTKVAGVVSGAKGLGSAVKVGSGVFDFNVALAGRVYCNVVALNDDIEPGDLLTTSGIPGYAMEVTDYAHAQGAVLGKAMEGLNKGEMGQILVLVTLQ
jgi:hypothetical protein